jgi:hypothetical protein
VSALLGKAQAAFAAATAALKNGNLALYQSDIQQGISYVNQAQALSGSGGAKPAGSGSGNEAAGTTAPATTAPGTTAPATTAPATTVP